MVKEGRILHSLKGYIRVLYLWLDKRWRVSAGCPSDQVSLLVPVGRHSEFDKPAFFGLRTTEPSLQSVAQIRSEERFYSAVNSNPSK